jgi:hypothetical protein
VPMNPICSHNVNDYVWAQLGVNDHSIVQGRIMKINGAFALLFIKDHPYDGLFITVHRLQLFDKKPDKQTMATANAIMCCISAAYASQRSSDGFPEVENGFISSVFWMSRATPSQKRMREDELFVSLTLPSADPMVHVGGRLARLPGHRQHRCNCGCYNMVSGEHICEVCGYGVYKQDCFGSQNEHNSDGICKPCFEAGLHLQSQLDAFDTGNTVGSSNDENDADYVAESQPKKRSKLSSSSSSSSLSSSCSKRSGNTIK